MARLHGCWQLVFVPCYMGLSLGLLEYLHYTVAVFPRASDMRDSKEEVTVSFRPNLRNLTPHFWHILFVRSELVSIAHIEGEINESSPLEGRSLKEFVDTFQKNFVDIF